jgi:hypothetical protein
LGLFGPTSFAVLDRIDVLGQLPFQFRYLQKHKFKLRYVYPVSPTLMVSYEFVNLTHFRWVCHLVHRHNNIEYHSVHSLVVSSQVALGVKSGVPPTEAKHVLCVRFHDPR